MPTSASVKVYELDVAPSIFEQEESNVLVHRFHWIAVVGVGVPEKVTLLVRVWPKDLVPEGAEVEVADG